MTVTIEPGCLRGTVTAISSKSAAHRLLLCAALCEEETDLYFHGVGQDVKATMECLKALGTEFRPIPGGYHIVPPTRRGELMGWNGQEKTELCVGESGTTLRMLLPILGTLGVTATLELQGRLPQRPLEPLASELRRCGMHLRFEGNRLFVSGRLREREFHLDGSVSSQFLSGLLFALCILGGGRLRVAGHIASAPYLTMTVDALRQFGAELYQENDIFYVNCDGLKSPGICHVEGDWSNAAYFLCADRLHGNHIVVESLNRESLQADRAILEVLKGMDTVFCDSFPDLVPPLCVYAALTPGRTRFCDCARLRLKESDRIAACLTMLRQLGAVAEETPDGFTVEGQETLQGGIVDSRNDHRIAMAAAIAASRCRTPVTVSDAQAVQKSDPAFWDTMRTLGASIKEV